MAKKVLSFILSLTLLMQIFVFGSSDVSAAKRDVSTVSDLEFLNALGIVDDVYEDITLGEKISRIDFALAVGRIFGNTVYTDEQEPQCAYTDMTSMGTEAVKAVNLLTDLGIISGSGDGTFRPYDNVTYEQAVKMLVCSLGYDVLAREKGGYPLGYFATGASIGVTDGISLQNSEQLTWEAFITLLANTLFIDLMENTSYGKDLNYTIVNGDTLLNAVMKIKHIENASITANSVTTVGGGSGVDAGYVEVNKLIFTDPKGIADAYIGKGADVYYKEDKNGKREIIYINADYTSLIVSYNDILEINGYQIKYYDKESRSEKRINVATDAVMLLNGQALFYTPSLIDLSLSGSICFEKHASSAYSVLNIECCTNMIVSAVDYSKFIVYDKMANNTPADLSSYAEDERLFVYKNGVKTDINGIENGALLSLYKSPDNSIMTVKVTNNTINGQITSYSDDTVVIDGNEYEFSPALKQDLQSVLGSYCTAYINELGQIVWFTISTTDSLRYGFVIDGGEETGMEEALYLRILTDDKKVSDYKIAEKIKLNSVTESDSIAAVKRELKNSSGYKQQLIQFSLNNDNEIRLINTPNTTGIMSDRYRYDGVCEFVPKGDYNFRSTRSTFSGRTNIDASTKVFVVSPNGSKDPEDYTISDSSFFVDGRSYKIAAYNADNGGKAGVIICWQELNSFSSVSLGGRVMMVDYITNARNADGEEVQKIYGLSGGKYVSYVTNGDVSLQTSTTPARPLKRGDIVNLAFSSKNEICYVKVLVDIDKQSTINYYYSANNAWTDNWAISGAFYSMEGSNAIISKSGPANIESIFANPNFEDMYVVNLSASIMIYDEQSDSVYVGTLGDILTYQNSGNDASRFFMRFYKDNLNTIFIFKR